jgi:dynein heavy chain
MKQGTPTFQNLTDATHMARQMQNDRNGFASTGASDASVPIPLGAHMREQFSEHMKSSAGAAFENDFIDQVMPMVGQVCTQVLLLKARVAFTELVEKSMDEGVIFGLEDNVKNARSMVINSMRDVLTEDVRASLTALQVLLQEQQHSAANLTATTDPVGVWEGEMRFYQNSGGSFECRCVGLRAAVDPETMDRSNDNILVTTDITRDVRRAFFRAAFGGADVLLVDGVAGTGKTETCKDICAMLGRNCVVMEGAKVDADLDWSTLLQPGNVICIDEANKAPRSAIEAAVSAAQAGNIPLCLTYNSKNGDDVQDVVGSFCAFVQTQVPDMPIILSSMLATEGLQQADDLGNRLSGLFNYFKTNCTKQAYYDWGLRKMRSVVKEVGKTAQASDWMDERQIMTAAVQASIRPGMAPIDESTFLRGVLEHFGADAFVPMQIPSDFWNAAASKISSTLARRHGSLCLPVPESDEPFVMAVLQEEAAKLGADVSCMPGRVEDLSPLDMFGGFVDGVWRDGMFTAALRDVVCGERPGWLLVFCGSDNFEPEMWEKLNTLLDDNKCLRLENGETIKLRPADRIVFAAPGVGNASPATVSRLGIVNLDANRRNRL